MGNDVVAKLLSNKDIETLDIAGAMFMERGYFTSPENFKDGIVKRFNQGFRIIAFFPKTHKYPFEANCCKEFYEILNYYNFPMMINCCKAIRLVDKKIIKCYRKHSIKFSLKI